MIEVPCFLMADGRAIEVEGLVREFKKGPRAVDGIDLYVREGEIYGFLGPNGAGKSTTVLMLTTLLPPTAGSARVGGYDIVRQGPQVRGVIGVALQEAALDPILSGREHLHLQLAAARHAEARRVERADAALMTRVALATSGTVAHSAFENSFTGMLSSASRSRSSCGSRPSVVR